MNFTENTTSPKRSPTLVILLVGAFALFLLATSFNSPLFAQHSDRERLIQEIERTDEMLEQVESDLQETRDAKASQLFQQAMALQRRAHEFFENGRYAQAWNMTSKARDVVKRILGELVSKDEDRTLVEQQLERTEEYLSRASQGLVGVDAPSQQMYLDEATRLQDRARELFSENNLRQSLQFTRRAQELLKKATDLSGNRERQEEQFDFYLHETHDDIEASRGLVHSSGSERAIRLFNVGTEQTDRAQQLFDMGRSQEAIRTLAQARSKIGQAERIAELGESPGGSLRAIELAQTRIGVLRDRAENSGNLDALDLLEEASEKLNRARGFHSQGEYDQALVIVRIVMELNQQAARILGG
jgi:hypothetical protein